MRPVNGKVPVRVLNSRENPVVLKNFCPTTRKLTEFETRQLEEPKLKAEEARKIINLINLSHLKGEEYDSLYRICLKYFDTFHDPDELLGVTNLYKENITLQKDCRPVYKKPYRLPHAQKKHNRRRD